jgi:hypothetical protein
MIEASEAARPRGVARRFANRARARIELSLAVVEQPLAIVELTLAVERNNG